MHASLHDVQVNFNEPTSILQRMVEDLIYIDILEKAAACESSLEQLTYLSVYSCTVYGTTSVSARVGKPFNPLLGETYECDRRAELGWRVFMEQVWLMGGVPRVQSHTHTHSHTHICTHTHAHIHMHIHSHTLACTHTCRHTHTHTHTHARTHTHTHTHTHNTHTHTTHTHTHTHHSLTPGITVSLRHFPLSPSHSPSPPSLHPSPGVSSSPHVCHAHRTQGLHNVGGIYSSL